MKLRKILATAAMALFVGATAMAQTPQEVRIYINPGHGSWTANDRPMSTIKHGANNAYSDPNNDTTNFFESNTNLQKGLAMLYKLVDYGVPFDPTKNQTNDEPSRVGAALDLSQNIVMSHVKAGAWPAYTDYDAHTANPDNSKYNRTLSVIAAEVEANDFDMFVSIHSNAASEGNTTNYLYFAWDNKYINSDGTPKNDEGAAIRDLSIEMAEKGWNQRILDRHTQWTHYDCLVGQGTVKIGQQNLGVLNHSVPGYLVEGYFHTYQPARHRAMNFAVDRLEGVDYARGVADYFGWEKESTGDIYGIVRDKHTKYTHDYYTPRAGTYDVYKPLNNVTVTLKKDGVVVATTETDDEWNGAFIFNNVEPGAYTLEFAHPDYQNLVSASYKATDELKESIEVTVKAATTSYPTAFLVDNNWVAPTISHVNYPDSTAGKAQYQLKSSYKLYADGEVKSLSAKLQDKTIRRTVLRNDTMYVLAIDAEKNPTLLIADIKNDVIVKELSTEGCEGTHLVLSDIQVTADGYLLGCAKEWTQCEDAKVYETGSEDHLKYGCGDERGECFVYKWEKDENGVATGDPIKWLSTTYTGNWYRAIVGETFAYTGTIKEGIAVLSAQSATATSIRNELLSVFDGEQSANSFHQPYINGNYPATTATSLGETYFYVTSPLHDDRYITVSAGPENIFEADFAHKDKTEAWDVTSADVVPASASNANFFKYAGKSLMVIPATNAEGKVTGIRMYDVTEGYSNAVEVELNGATLAEPVAATYASAHGKLKLTLNEVTGATTDATINLVLVTDSVMTKFTVTPPPAEKITLTRGEITGTANPFAYDLSGEVAEDVLTVKYALNVDAQAVKVNVLNAEGTVVASVDGVTTKGAQTATVSVADLAEGEYTWEVAVEGDAKTKVARFSSVSFYHPAGLDVDNSFESPSFGTLAIAEGYTDKKTSGYVSAQADGTEGGGLYMYNPAGEIIKNEVTGGVRFFPEGYTVSKYLNGSNTSGSDFGKVAFAADGRIFAARYNNEGNYIVTAPSVAELAKTGKFTSLVEGMTMTDTKVYNDTEGNFLVGPVQGFDVKGGGEETVLLALTRADNSVSVGANLNRIVEYKLGTDATISTAIPTAIDQQYTIAYDKSANVVYDNRGGMWYCQYRDAPTDEVPSLVYVDAEGKVQFFEGAGGKTRRRGAISVSPDGTMLAAASAQGFFSVYEIEYDATGAVSLIEKYYVEHKMGNNNYALAWGAAGNVYASNASGELVDGYSIPRENNTFVTKAASKYAFKLGASAIEEVDADENAPVEYYNLQGVKVENPENGIFIKKQGKKTTKVVM